MIVARAEIREDKEEDTKAGVVSRGTKVRPSSLIKPLRAFLEEVTIEEEVTKEVLIEVEDQVEETHTFLV